MEQLADDILIRRTRAGSRPAFGQLVTRYQEYVFTICMRVLRDREAAEEAAQDAFLKVHQRLDQFQGDSRFSSWLYTIAYRTALDQARLKKRPVQATDFQEAHPARKVADTKQADTPVEQMDLRGALETGIRQLKAEEGAVITLFYLQEQSIKEIASITDLSISNVKTKLHRGREALRKILREQLQKEITDWI